MEAFQSFYCRTTAYFQHAELNNYEPIARSQRLAVYCASKIDKYLENPPKCDDGSTLLHTRTRSREQCGPVAERISQNASQPQYITHFALPSVYRQYADKKTGLKIRGLATTWAIVPKRDAIVTTMMPSRGPPLHVGGLEAMEAPS